MTSGSLLASVTAGSPQPSCARHQNGNLLIGSGATSSSVSALAAPESNDGRRAWPKHYCFVWLPVETPAGQFVPAIISLETGEILFEAWSFFTAPVNRGKSGAWFRKAAHALGSLYEFFQATTRTPLTSATGERLIHDFVDALEHGTIQPDGSDPKELYWPALSESRVIFIRGVVREFCKFCDDLHGPDHVLASGRFLGVLRLAHAREAQRKHSKLYHLGSRARQFNERFNATPADGLKIRPAKSFPRPLLMPLIFEGCKRDRVATDYKHPLANENNITLMLAVVLLAGGGIRKSELLHIFADDIRGEEVRLYHPERGQIAWQNAAAQRVVSDRKEFLAVVHGLRPRTQLAPSDALFCGWKGMLIDFGHPQNYSRLQWISPEFRELFRVLHGIYVRYVRPTALNHPYYFVSLSQGQFGQPWTVGAFDDAFKSALQRIGEQPDAEQGLNPHGLRHLFGQTLTDMGLSPLIIQHAMHHRSIESQLAYTKPPPEKVSQALTAAAARFNTDDPRLRIEPSALETYEWKSDPLKIFAPWNLGGL